MLELGFEILISLFSGAIYFCPFISIRFRPLYKLLKTAKVI